MSSSRLAIPLNHLERNARIVVFKLNHIRKFSSTYEFESAGSDEWLLAHFLEKGVLIKSRVFCVLGSGPGSSLSFDF